MKVGVVGGGVVGKATARSLIEHVDEMCVYDIDPKKSTHSRVDVLACDLIFVCLPTPQKKDSLECDTSILEKFFKVVGEHLPQENFILRSTVPVGFTRQMSEKYGLTNLCHSPEFLTARCSITDAHLPARNIIGSPTKGTENECAKILHDLYRQRFPGVPCIVCDSNESELIKLATNGAFAVKIAYFNEVRRLADAFDVNWSIVLAGILTDGRIAHSHTKVPGPDGKYGFGPDTPQNCLKKDLANLITCIQSTGQVPHVTMATHVRNVEDRQR